MAGSTPGLYKQGPANRPSWPWSFAENTKKICQRFSLALRMRFVAAVFLTSFWRTCFDNGDELELKPEILSSIYLPASESVFHALNIIQHVDGCSSSESCSCQLGSPGHDKAIKTCPSKPRPGFIEGDVQVMFCQVDL